MAQAANRMAGSLAKKIPQLGQASLNFAKPRAETFWRYAKVELRPPTMGEMPQVQVGFNNLIKAARTQAWKNLTVKEALLNSLVGIEIACWFYIGECIGKRSLIGYQIPGAVDFGAHI